MTAHFTAPAGYQRIGLVNSFEELVTRKFGPEINALCWPRALPGNFDEIAACFKDEDEITSLDEEILNDLKKCLSPAGREAADVLIKDQRLLTERNLQPSVECVPRYNVRDLSEIIPTDVYSFHVDSATVAADTYLCSYNEAATEGLRNEDALRHIDIPETRALLHKEFEQQGGGEFDLWLRENCYDHHYAAQPSAVPFSFGFGHLWRIAIEYPGCPVVPCVHRAPKTVAGRLPRLLLIS